MSRTGQILIALRGGAQTSGEIARMVRSGRGTISVALCRLADLGVVERHGCVSETRIGRPYVRWRTARPRLTSRPSEPLPETKPDGAVADCKPL